MIDAGLLSKKLSYFTSLSNKDLLDQLNTSDSGLSTDEATLRLKTYGKNVIKEEVRLHFLVQFLANFKNPLILILLLVAFISLLTGEHIDALLVALMVVMSVTMNFIQEYKASEAATKLKEQIATLSTVLRDGKKAEILVSDLCIGDILYFNAGDLISADCRLLTSKDFFVNQSALTGESFPVEKSSLIQTNDAKKSELGFADYPNILLHGTNVVTGSGVAVVVKTGNNTEFGKIAQNIVAPEVQNEFTKGVNDFSVLILKVIIFFVLFIFLVNSLIKHDLLESLLFSIAVAVGLTPEFLPVIMSVNMGIGSLNMSKKGVIVKKLSAIPTFGSLDVLCTDKTGTLTEDKIKLIKCVDLNGNDSEQVFTHAYLNSYYQTGINNPMDGAIIDHKKLDITEYKKIDEIPFDFNRKKMSVVVATPTRRFMVTKGAPEEIFKSCNYFEDSGSLKPLDINKSDILIDEYLRLSSEGFRVLAIAVKELTDNKTIYEADDEVDMNLLGYTAFLDPPKEGAREALDSLEEMGIEVKIITGDNELVSEKICRDVNVSIKGVMLGSEIRDMSDVELAHKVNNITIFARFSPDDKNRVIKSLKQNGHVVGYMGDGINDTPSLRTADVGISVSNAVDIAKESADIILTRKSLHLLKDGVIEGRKTFGNTMKYIMMGISSNFGNMFSVLGAVIFLPFLPMLPIQILLNNFLYDFSQITIPTDNVDSDFIHKPKRWNIKFIRNFMFVFGPISSFYDFLTFVVLYFLFKNIPGSFQTGWFMESLATQTLVIHIIRTRQIPFIQSKPSKYLLGSTLIIVILGWLIPFTQLGNFFGFTPLPLYALGILLLIVVCYLVTVEIGKRKFFEKYFDLQ